MEIVWFVPYCGSKEDLTNDRMSQNCLVKLRSRIIVTYMHKLRGLVGIRRIGRIVLTAMEVFSDGLIILKEWRIE